MPSAGADLIINRKTEDIPAKITECANRRGVARIVDMAMNSGTDINRMRWGLSCGIGRRQELGGDVTPHLTCEAEAVTASAQQPGTERAVS